MRYVYVILIFSLFIFAGTGCEDEHHDDHMDQDYDEMHDDPQGMTDMYGMEDHMHDLQLRSGHMMDDWENHMGETTRMDTVYGHSMMNMSRHMHDMGEDMYGIMSDMNTLMNNEQLMQNEAYKNHLKQMQRHMNQMMDEYESMLDQMQEMNNDQ